MQPKTNIGDKYGNWTVIKREESSKAQHSRFQCQCECGNIRIIYGSSLRRFKNRCAVCVPRKKPVKALLEPYVPTFTFVPPFVDFKNGYTFGCWTILSKDRDYVKKHNYRYLCICRLCGSVRKILNYHIRTGIGIKCMKCP